MIAVKTLLDINSLWIYFLNHEISIHFLGCCKNNKAVVRVQSFQELADPWTNFKFLIISKVPRIFEMNKSFIKI